MKASCARQRLRGDDDGKRLPWQHSVWKLRTKPAQRVTMLISNNLKCSKLIDKLNLLHKYSLCGGYLSRNCYIPKSSLRLSRK